MCLFQQEQKYVTCNVQDVVRDECREGVSKTALKGKGLVVELTPTPDLEYSPVCFSKKCFALKADCFHPFERVPNIEVAVAAKATEESVSAEFDVVAHHSGVHSNKFNRKGINDIFHLNCNGASDDLHNSGFWKLANK